MPNPLIKAYAKKSGHPEHHIEKLWNEAKRATLNKFGLTTEDSVNKLQRRLKTRFWGMVTAITQRQAGIEQAEMSLEDIIAAIRPTSVAPQDDDDENDEFNIKNPLNPRNPSSETLVPPSSSSPGNNVLSREQVTAMSDNYHSVFYKNGDRWHHHFDADNKEDAEDERRSMRNQGEKSLRLVVPKKEANWYNRDPHKYVMDRLANRQKVTKAILSYIEQAGASASVLKKIREHVSADQISSNKEGHVIARRAYFYRHGDSHDKYAGRVSEQLTKAGIKHKIIKSEDHWKPFKGGASVKTQSHFAVHLQIGPHEEHHDKPAEKAGFDWPYYKMHNGWLHHEKDHPTKRAFKDQPHPFKSSGEAESWLSANDHRGNVKDAERAPAKEFASENDRAERASSGKGLDRKSLRKFERRDRELRELNRRAKGNNLHPTMDRRLDKLTRHIWGPDPMGDHHGTNAAIVNPNSSGQGHDEDHVSNPFHDTILKHGYKYSHSTKVHQRDGSSYNHHTYAHGEHKVGVGKSKDGQWKWDSQVSSASGHSTSGTYKESLDKHLTGKAKRYKLQATAYEQDLEDNSPRRVSGVRGPQSKPFAKTFKNQKAMEKWMEQHEGEHHIHQVQRAFVENTSSWGQRTRTMKTGTIKNHPWHNARVKVKAGEHAGKEGHVSSVVREPTFSQMVPYRVVHNVKFDGDGGYGEFRSHELKRLDKPAKPSSNDDD